MTSFKVGNQYIIAEQAEIFKIAILDLTQKSIRVENLDNGKIVRALLSDFTPNIIEEIVHESNKNVIEEIQEKENENIHIDFFEKTLKENEYQDIPNYIGHYQVNRKGNVRSLKGGSSKYLKPNGVGKVILSLYGKTKAYDINELVTMTFNEWKDIPGFEGIYKINRDGEVINSDNKKLKLISGKLYFLYKRPIGTKSYLKEDLLNQTFN